MASCREAGLIVKAGKSIRTNKSEKLQDLVDALSQANRGIGFGASVAALATIAFGHLRTLTMGDFAVTGFRRYRRRVVDLSPICSGAAKRFAISAAKPIIAALTFLLPARRCQKSSAGRAAPPVAATSSTSNGV